MSAFLQVENLLFHYPSGAAALNHLSLKLEPGEKVALVGANGSGKSTLLLHLAGCLTPHAGAILLQGHDIAGNPRKAGVHMGLLFQNPDFQLLMPSVREELLLALHDSALPPMERVACAEKLAHTLGFSRLLDNPPHRLSAGEKQLVALGTLLITQPSLLLLDEPSAALDPSSRRALIHFLNQLDTALLLATHDLDMALQVAERVIILRQGNIVADGPSRALLADAALLAANNLELPLCLQPPAWWQRTAHP